MNAFYRSVLPFLSLIAVALGGGCATVGPGHAGVLWTASGGTQPVLYGEGKHPIAAWNKMYIYDLRSLSHDEPLAAMTVNGMMLKLGTTVRYHVVPTEVVALQEEIGPDYYAKLLAPLLRAEARRVISHYTAEEVYSTKQDGVEAELVSRLNYRLAGRHLTLEAVLLRDVELPASVRAAIDQKFVTEQQALRMKYVLAIARSTVEQKQIEAQGVAEFNRIVKPGLTHEVLELERLQQLGKLAGSTNAKMLVIGSGVAPAPVTILTHDQAAATK